MGLESHIGKVCVNVAGRFWMQKDVLLLIDWVDIIIYLSVANKSALFVKLIFKL